MVSSIPFVKPSIPEYWGLHEVMDCKRWELPNNLFTSESFGLPATADFMFALMTSEELDQLNQMKVKQLKNRYSDPAINRSFIIGVDRSKMRLYDVEQKAQNIVDANQEKEIEVDPYDKFSDFKV